jgi:hypothetical protein
MILKKFTFIFVLILFGASGILSGCLGIYDRMKLELSAEEIELFLPLSTEDLPADEEELGEEQPMQEEPIVEESLGENAATFTAKVSKAAKNVLKGVTYQTTNDSIILVEEVEREENITTLKVTGLRPGQTQLIVKTLEGNKQETISVNVIKRLEEIELNSDYKLAAAVGQDVDINTAQAINFYPFNTNQKDIIYTLENEVEGVSVSEAGKITVTEKTVDEINVIATSLVDETKQVVLQVAILQPILADDLLITTQSKKDELAQWIEDGGLEEDFDLKVDSLLMANNHADANEGQLIIEVASSEVYNLVATSSAPERVEIVSIQDNKVYIKANNLGGAEITIKAEITGYENYYAQKTVAVTVVNLATSVLINDSSATRTFDIYNNYSGVFGRELNIKTGPIGAYYKEVKLSVAEEDVDKITIRYSDGTAITGEAINEIILPMNMSVYVEANYLSDSQDPLVAEEENTVEIDFIANYILNEGLWAKSSAVLNLTQGVEDVIMPADLSLEKGLSVGDYPNVNFEILPESVTNVILTLEVENTSIASYEEQSNSVYKIIAKNEGVTKIWVTTSNGIRKFMRVEVYVELDGAALAMEGPETNYNVVDMSFDTAPEEYETLSSATVAVGAGIQTTLLIYPTNTSTNSITYSSSNPSVASVNNNGYIVTKSLGSTTITATISSKQFSDSTTSTLVTTQKSFLLNTYVPIKDISLSEMQIEVYEQNYLGYYDLNKGEHQLTLSINPSNATFNQDDVAWSSSSPYITIEDGLITASIPRDEILPNNTVTATVTASIIEYGRYYAKTAIVTIKRAVPVDSITVFGAPEGYVYFDIREGIDPEDNKQISVQTYPYNATNPNVRYLYAQDDDDHDELPVFNVSESGLITPVRAGVAKLVVVAEDSFVDDTTYGRYNEIVVKVADGLTEETALEISTRQDLLSIDTVNELSLHYVLANNIDLMNAEFTPIGLINEVANEFTGSINGRFVYENIDKQYRIKNLNINTTTSSPDNYLGLVAINSGVLKNLQIEVNNFNASATNNGEGSNSYFSAIAAINNGLIENVSVNVFNSDISLAAQNSYVGIITAVNNGNIINPVAYGNLEVKQASGLSVSPLAFVGGIAGLNNTAATITGEYVPANKALEGEVQEIAYTNKYQKEGMNSFATIDTGLLTNINNASGIAVGNNLGTITNIATDGQITGLNNVGGLVGINEKTIQNSYSSSKVNGIYNVGGLVGSAILGSEIFNNAVEIYDRELNQEQATVYIRGKNNVGGLIGYAESLELLSYNYVNSYYLRELGVNYEGDIVIDLEDETADYYVGGLIGFVTNTQAELTKNYVKATIVANQAQTASNTPSVYAGGLFGALSGNFDLNNSYNKGKISLPAQNSYAGGLAGFVTSADNSSIDYSYSVSVLTASTTQTAVALIDAGSVVNTTNLDYTVWDLTNSTVWYEDEAVNEGLPALYNENGNLLINEVPESITVIVNEQVITKNEADGTISFNHIKAGDKRVIVLMTEEDYQISSLITTTPASSRYYVSTLDTDIVQILDEGKIRVLREGVATITVSSLLNTNISDTFELAVVKAFTNFSLSQTQNAETGQLKESDLLQIKLDESIILYSNLNNPNYSVTNNSGVIYSASTSDFTVNNYELDATLTNVENHVLKGITASTSNIEVKATPYFAVMFGEEVVTIDLEVLQKTFYVRVYAGATAITTELASATIGLKQELNLGVYVTTDKASEGQEDITVEYSDVEGDDGDSISQYIEVEYIESENIENNERIYKYIIKANPEFLEVSSGSGNFKSAKSGFITFTPASNTDLSTTFNITITPEDLLRIDMEHYPSGETKIENGIATYYPEELPSNIIAPGKAGILKINLFPEYANVDYYEIVSSQPIPERFISFEQVALTKDSVEYETSVKYTRVNPSPALIDFGTTLNLISTADKTGDEIEYSFDGNIYVKTLIASSVAKGTVFTVTVTGYRIDEYGVPQQNLTKQIELTVDALPGITLLYNGATSGEVARGTTVPLTVAVEDNYSGTLQNPIATINRTDNANDENESGETITVENPLVYYADINKDEEGDYYLSIGPGVPSGSSIVVSATVKKLINGIEETITEQIRLTVVDFVIEAIKVEQTVSGQTNTMKMFVDETNKLSVNLIVQKFDSNSLNMLSEGTTDYNNMQTIFANITNRLTQAENSISRNIKNWYQRTESGSTAIDNSLWERNYDNFSIIMLKQEEPDYLYDFEEQKDIHVKATNISTNVNLVAKVEYYYDINGRVQTVVTNAGGDYFKYPQNHIYDEQETRVEQDYLSALKTIEYDFYLNIISNSTEDKPIPIYNEQELADMQAGVDYILLNEDKDIPFVLEDWVPLNTAIKSLDGNGRTIIIKSFAPDATEGAYNFGFFGTVNQETVLKNIVVDVSHFVSSQPMINATEFSEINFGFIAGVNYGTISNSDVVNSSSLNQAITLNTLPEANTTFGGLIGVNSGGYITNSRVGKTEYNKHYTDYYPISLKARGNVAGFAGYNSGVITSSYSANLALQNLSTNNQNSRTSGFVGINSTNGRISLSFVEGIKDSYAEEEGEVVKTLNALMEGVVIQGGGLDAIGTVGGFVHENQGEISDSYSNTPITTESRSAGFVYKNMQEAIVKNAYSASKIVESTTANLPFVGSNNLEELLDDGEFINTYYLANTNYFTTQFAGEYPAIAVEEGDFGKTTSFTGFGFLTEINYDSYGAWTMSVDTVNPRPIISSAIEQIYSRRVLASQTVTGGTVTANYYDDASDVSNRGTGNNPIMIATASQFLEAMTWDYYLDSEKVNRNKIKLIRDINFAEVTNDADLLKLQDVIFTGILDGNGMKLNNVRVLSPIGADPLQDSFGMFYKIGYDDTDYIKNKNEQEENLETVIKNLSINVVEISATEAVSVGVLSGIISNSVIMNIDINGQQITVQGRNLVGGLAGQITGNSRIMNITSNISVSSEYRTTDAEGEGNIVYSYYNEYDEDQSDNKVPAKELSYAGGIAGAIDLYTISSTGVKQESIDWQYENPKVMLLEVNGRVRIRGEKSGGVVGYVGPFTYIKNALFQVEHLQENPSESQSIVGFNLLGGVVAENSGRLDHARIEHLESYQQEVIDETSPREIVGYQDLFKEDSQYTGGLVGYNNMGTILNSYSRVDIVNSEIEVAGGLVGVNYAGLINRVYASGHISIVNADIDYQVIGGLIGVFSNTSLQKVDGNGVSQDETSEIYSAFAFNNWQAQGTSQNKTYNNVSDNGIWQEQEDDAEEGVYDEKPDKFIGAFIGEKKDDTTINFEGQSSGNNFSLYIDEVFYDLSDSPKRTLREIGNKTLDQEDLVNVLAVEPEDDLTQFETVTNSNSKATTYVNFTSDGIWTLENARFAKLLFSDLESFRPVDNEDALIGALSSYKTATIVVMNDIYLTKKWEPKDFRGILIGAKKEDDSYPTIYNLNIESSANDVAFFSVLEIGNLLNLNFVVGGQNNVSWEGEYPNGIVSTYNEPNSKTAVLAANVNNSAIKNVNIKFANDEVNFSASSQYVGLVVANANKFSALNVKVSSITNDFAVNGEVLATNLSQVDDKYMYVGGAFGKLKIADITDVCVKDFNFGITSNYNLYAGGLVGLSENTSLITNSNKTYSTANIDILSRGYTGDDVNSAYVGGVVGRMVNNNLTKVYATGTITIDKMNDIDPETGPDTGVNFVYVGGVAGELYNVIANEIYYENSDDYSINLPETNNVVRMGGLVGLATRTSLEQTYAIANLNAQNKIGETYIGGLIGNLTSDFDPEQEDYEQNSYSFVNLSYAKTNIALESSNLVYIGGLIGSTENAKSDKGVTQSYSEGELNAIVSGSSRIYAGGLIGFNDLQIKNAFSSTNLSIIGNSPQSIGGLIGENNEYVETAFSYGTVYSNKNASNTINPSVGVNNGYLQSVRFNKDLIGLTDRSNNSGAVALSQQQLIGFSLVGSYSNYWTKTETSYPYLKNIQAPNIEEGSLMAPIEVDSYDMFASINNSDEYYYQTANFNYYGQVVEGQPTGLITNFSGKYNGNGYIIDYTHSLSNGTVGLFETINSGAMVANLGVNANITLTGGIDISYDIGGLATTNNGIIYKSYSNTVINNKDSVDISTGNFGGLVAINNSLIEHSFAKVELNIKSYSDTSDTYIGGLAGQSAAETSTINTSMSSGFIVAEQEGTATLYTAGLVGKVTGNVLNSFSSVVIDNIGGEYGGLFAFITEETDIINSYHDVLATGEIYPFDSTYGSTTVYMTSTSFYLKLIDDGNVFDAIWSLDETINYGYPYPSYYDVSAYESNVLLSGDGTDAYPYLIHHAGRLDWIRTQLTKPNKFKQIRNIDLFLFNQLTDDDALNNEKQFNPIGSVVNNLGISADIANRYATSTFDKFTGAYDGQNYSINNLKQTFNTTAATYGGLFAYLEGGVEGTGKYGQVDNVRLINVDIEVDSGSNMGTAYLGAIAGRAVHANITNSSASSNEDGVIDQRDKEQNRYKSLNIGGLIGHGRNSSILNSNIELKIKASFGKIGGIAGSVDNSIIENTHYDGEILLTMDENNTGIGIYYVIGGIAGSSYNSQLLAVSSAGEINVEAFLNVPFDKQANNEGIGGIAGYVSDGTVANATNYANITTETFSKITNSIGGLIGRLRGDSAVIEALENQGNIEAYYANDRDYSTKIGGVIGHSYETSDMEVFGLRNNANIVAIPLANGELYDYSLDLYVGGVTGHNTTYKISQSYNAGNITAKGPQLIKVGGIAGQSDSDIYNSYNDGEILADYNDYTPERSGVDYDDLTDYFNAYAGGIAGHITAGVVVKNSYNANSVTIQKDYEFDTSDISYSAGLLSGGIAGLASGANIEESYNSGNISAKTNEKYIQGENNNYTHLYVGGIVGVIYFDFFDFNIENVYNTGDISADFIDLNTAYLGGIAGSTTYDGVIQYSYNIGNILIPSGYSYHRGQIVGRLSSYTILINNLFENKQVIDYYKTGEVYWNIYMGSYGYEFTASQGTTGKDPRHGQNNDSETYGRTISQMKQRSTYSAMAWDITVSNSIWIIEEDVSTPTLRDEGQEL